MSEYFGKANKATRKFWAFCNSKKKSEGKITHKKIEIDGIVFDSKLEAQRYEHLKLMELAKVIKDLKAHPKFELQERFRDSEGVAQRAITYTADFSYQRDGELIVEDVKSPFTAKDSVFRLKSKMFRKIYPNYKFYVVLYAKNKGGWYYDK